MGKIRIYFSDYDQKAVYLKDEEWLYFRGL